MKTKIEEIIKKVNETDPTIEGAQKLINQIFLFRGNFDENNSNGIIMFKNSKEWIIKEKLKDLLSRYTINEQTNIDKMREPITRKLNPRNFESCKKEFLNILNYVLSKLN
ncbi:MAG: hypothetical protein WC599_06895 [Bacteroidales bacterium]